jgi:hypothetical protein
MEKCEYIVVKSIGKKVILKFNYYIGYGKKRNCFRQMKKKRFIQLM